MTDSIAQPTRPRVSFLDLARQHAEMQAEAERTLRSVLSRGAYLLGAETEAFEREWAAWCGVRAAATVANGTDALTLLLLACGVSGDRAHSAEPPPEVITTPLTAPYTALAIRNAGCLPVFADIDSRTLTLDPGCIEPLITERTRAVVPVHLYGQMADMKAICRVAARHDLTVIEDAAQAHGAILDGRAAGAHGAAAAYSFYPTKNLGAYGDGGAVVSDDPRLIDEVKALRQGGHQPALSGETAGRNSRIDELQAALLRLKLRRLADWTETRRRIAARYTEALAGTGAVAPAARAGRESHVFHLYVAQHDRRGEVRAHLAARGVETMIHYPTPLHRTPLFRDGWRGELPAAEAATQRVFSVPLNPHLSEEEVEIVCDALASIGSA